MTPYKRENVSRTRNQGQEGRLDQLEKNSFIPWWIRVFYSRKKEYSGFSSMYNTKMIHVHCELAKKKCNCWATKGHNLGQTISWAIFNNKCHNNMCTTCLASGICIIHSHLSSSMVCSRHWYETLHGILNQLARLHHWLLRKHQRTLTYCNPGRGAIYNITHDFTHVCTAIKTSS